MRGPAHPFFMCSVRPELAPKRRFSLRRVAVCLKAYPDTNPIRTRYEILNTWREEIRGEKYFLVCEQESAAGLPFAVQPVLYFPSPGFRSCRPTEYFQMEVNPVELTTPV